MRTCLPPTSQITGREMAQVVVAQFTDRKVHGSNPTSASRRPLSRLGQPGSIPALVLPSGGMTARHRKGATTEQGWGGVALWLEREFTDRKARGSNPIFASRLPLSILGQPGRISALVFTSGDIAARYLKRSTTERPVYLAAVRTVKQAVQQAALARMLNFLCTGVCYAS
ncbi:hypothetical protein CSKR_100132 [Clonorchis sinensis]|uniref:Uncharacterized protein n=1 Tax=Clonorchis sinensis TaxID=79923 RepID=A0A3R7FCZ0_CLOSI|nr:hypothetical protein CSKR_100132 [Clonorchis sinensis]